VRSVLLDLDGTLTDPREGIARCIGHALRGLGVAVPPEEALLRYIGPPLADAFRELLPDPSEPRVARAVALYRERFRDAGLLENRVYAGIPELLEGIARRGWRAAIATSKPRVFAERIARHFGLRARLGAVYGSELDGRRVRKDELLAHALEGEGVAPADAVMVGDRHHDVEGARANGLASIGVTWGYGSREELVRAGATWVCDVPAAVLRTLEGCA